MSAALGFNRLIQARNNDYLAYFDYFDNNNFASSIFRPLSK